MATYYMTDTGRSAAFLNYALDAGTAPTITQPYMLRLMTAAAAGNGNTNGSNGTQATTTNCPGYTANGSSLGASGPFGSFSATSPVGSNVNAVSWNATGTWSSIVGIEIWDSAATPLRWFQGPLTTAVSGVVNGDTVQFAAGGSISLSAQAW